MKLNDNLFLQIYLFKIKLNFRILTSLKFIIPSIFFNFIIFI